ncbi:MAG: ThuA domain-containing protein [bacterium]|nr:ThuA domain-containing protein [bacterium]
MSTRILMLSGSFEYDSEESLILLRDYLHANADVSCELILFTSAEDHPSLVAVDDADVVVVFTRRLLMQGVELARLQQYCRDGRPIVGLRTGSHAFAHWLEFDRDVLGGNYAGHHASGVGTAVTVAPDAGAHPILEGVEAFVASGALYRNTPIAADTHLLLVGNAGDHHEPVAWTCERAGRAFYTSLGHQRDFWELDFLRLLRNGILWSVDQSSTAR